jgi:DNA-binding LytR/AlgR family response regulator
VHALDYLTKPVEADRLQATLSRVRERIASQAALVTQEQLKSVLTSLENGGAARQEFPRRLLIHNGAKDSFVNVQDIEWIEAADYEDAGSAAIRTYSSIHHRQRGPGHGDFPRRPKRGFGGS